MIIESRDGSVLDQEVVRSSQVVNIFLKIEPTESAEKKLGVRCEKQRRSSFKDGSKVLSLGHTGQGPSALF